MMPSAEFLNAARHNMSGSGGALFGRGAADSADTGSFGQANMAIHSRPGSIATSLYGAAQGHKRDSSGEIDSVSFGREAIRRASQGPDYMEQHVRSTDANDAAGQIPSRAAQHGDEHKEEPQDESSRIVDTVSLPDQSRMLRGSPSISGQSVWSGGSEPPPPYCVDAPFLVTQPLGV
jgi:hypothetical protein